MAEFKGTKGKWIVSVAEKGETNNVLVKTENTLAVVNDCFGKAIGLFGRIDNEEACANAKLIAAAPKLLEALTKAIILLQSTTEFEVLNSFKEKVSVLELTIKKATE